MTAQSQTPADPLLRVSNLEVAYPRRGRQGPIRVVHGIDLVVGRGETVGLVGESGSGKSTIGAAILGLIPSARGTIEFDRADITNAPRARRRQLASRMQVIFQDAYGSMNPTRTVGDTVTEALRYTEHLDRATIRERLVRALSDVGLPPTAAERYPSEFSGGQRQRIAIARALVMEPEFILCDEPTSALDLSVQAQVLNLLASLKASRGLSYLFISHDLPVVRYLSDEIIVLRAGEIVEHGPAAQVADAPRHPYTKALLMAAPVPDPEGQRIRRDALHRLRESERRTPATVR